MDNSRPHGTPRGQFTSPPASRSTRLRILRTGGWIALLAMLLSSSAALAGMRIATGSYTGNGWNSRSFTGIGFAPDVVIVSGSNSRNSAIRTAEMTEPWSKSLGDADWIDDDMIRTLDADGFTVGDDNQTNRSGESFYWTAFKASPGEMVHGSYWGDGSDNRSITGVGFSPEYLIVFQTADVHAVHRFGTQTGDRTFQFNEANHSSNRIQQFLSDGFQVGSSVTTNEGSSKYFYVAWNEAPGVMLNDTYEGNDNDNRNIDGFGFKPDLVVLDANGNSWAPVHRIDSMPNDLTLYFDEYASFSNGIQRFIGDGFQVGSSWRVNYDDTTYHYVGFVDNSVESADLALTKSVDEEEPLEGDTVTFTLLLTNNGPAAATSVAVTDLLPAGLTFDDAIPSQGSYDGDTGIWSVGDLSIGDDVALLLSALVDDGTAGSAIENEARVSARDQSDSDSSNDSDTATITVQAADIGIYKSVDDDTPNEGATIEYTIAARNGGPHRATSIVITDILPSGVTFAGASPSAGSYDEDTGLWEIDEIPAGDFETLLLEATVDDGIAGSSITNVASLTSLDQSDTDSSNDSDEQSITVQSVDLALGKTVDEDRVAEGDAVEFTLTLDNAGPDEATGVLVTDLLPAGLVYIDDSPSHGSYDADTGVWSVGSLGDGARAELLLRARIDEGTAGTTITNTGTITAVDQADPDADNDTAVAKLVVEAADISLVKVVDVATANEGDAVGFTISAVNAGPDPATTVRILDAIPAGLSISTSVTDLGTYDTDTGIWAFDTLPVGGSAKLVITTTVEAGTAGSTLTNTASLVSLDQTDPKPSNDEDSAEVTVLAVDLWVDKSVDDAAPNEGDTVEFTVVVGNDGPDEATGVRVIDILPSELTHTLHTVDEGSYSTQSGLWTIPALGIGDEATLVLTATVKSGTSGATITNTAAVAGLDQVDSDSENDSDSATLTVQAADLALEKNVDLPNPNEGDIVTFALSLSNDGPHMATGVLVTDLLPAGLLYASSSPDAGTYDEESGIWDVGSLGSGVGVELTISATVASGTAGDDIQNSASITGSDQSDPDSGNDTDTATIQVQSADLGILKTVDDPSPSELDTIEFTIDLTNHGPDEATGIEVTDLIPAGLTYVNDSATRGSYDDGTGIWAIASLSDSEIATLEIRVTVDGGTGGTTMTNTASITAADQGDPNAGNNSSSAQIGSESADLSLSKSVDDPTPGVGQTIEYTIELSNLGTNDADVVEVTDLLPSGVTFASYEADQGAYDFGSGVWAVGSVANGSSTTLTITATVDSDAAGNAIVNLAAVTAVIQADPNGSNNSDTATITVQSADIAIDQFVDMDDPNEGDTLVFTIAARNGGPSGATSLEVLSLLPSQLTYAGSDPSAGSYSSGTGIWTVGSLSDGATATLELSGIVNPGTAGDLISNTAAVSGVDQSDPNSSNNSTTRTVEVQSVDLALELSVDDALPSIGDVVTFLIELSNEGPSDATGVEVEDLLPGGLDYVASDASFGSYDDQTGIWTIPSLWAGNSAELEISAEIEPGTGGVALSNVATVVAIDQADIDSSNDTAAVDVAVAFSISASAAQSGVELLPGQSGTELLRVVLANDSTEPIDLQSFSVTNVSVGPGSDSELDASWLPVSLRIERSGEPTKELGTANFGAELATFSGFSEAIPAGGTADLVVRGGASLHARDGDGLDLQIDGADRFQFASEVDLVGSWPLAPNGAFVVDGMAAAQIDVSPLPSTQAVVGESNILGLDVLLPSNGYDSDTLDRLRVSNEGTAEEGADIERLRLWRDGGDGFFDPNGDDSSLGTAVVSGSYWVWENLSESVSVSGLPLFISLDLSESATSGRSIDLSLPGSSGEGVRMTSGNDGPLDQSVGNTVPQVIVGDPNAVVEVSASQPGGMLTAAGPASELLQVEIENRTGADVSLASVLVSDNSSGPGNREQLDASWGELTLSVLDTAEPAGRTLRLGGGAATMAMMSAGIATFENLVITIPVEESVILVVTGGASALARDSDLLDLELAGPEALVFSETVPILGAWPLSPKAAYTVDGMGAGQITLHPVPAGQVFRGDDETLAFDVTVPANGYESDVLESVRLQSLEDAAASQDITALDLWRDGGDGQFDQGSGDDSVLGAAEWDGAYWAATSLNQAVAVDGLRLFASVDIDSAATSGRRVRFGVPTSSFQMASGNDGPVDNTVENPDALTIVTDPATTIQIEAVDQEDRTLRPGIETAEVFQFVVTAGSEVDEILRSLTVRNSSGGSGTQEEMDLSWTVLSLFAGEEPIGTASFVGGEAVFTDLSLAVSAGQSETVRIEAGASIDARDGDVLDLRIQGPGQIQFEQTIDLQSEWPLDPAGTFTVDGMTTAQIELGVGDESEVFAGEKNRLAFEFIVPSNGYETDVLRTARIQNQGSAVEGVDIDSVELWKDGGNGNYDGGDGDDVSIGVGEWTGDRWLFGDLIAPVPLDGLRIFATVDVDSLAVEGRTVRLGLPGAPAAGLLMESGNDGPIDASHANPAQLTIVQPIANVISVSASLQTPRGLLPGGDPETLLGLDLVNFTSAPETLNTLTIDDATLGAGSVGQLDANWAAFRLDTESSASDGAAAPLAVGEMVAGVVTFSGFEIVLPLQESVKLYVRSAASLEARDGDVLDLRVRDASSFGFLGEPAVFAGWPIDPLGSFPVDGMSAEQIEIYPIESTHVAAGTARNLSLDLRIPPNGYQSDLLDRLDVVLLGTAADGSDIVAMEAWSDEGDGVFDPDTDPFLGSLIHTGSRWELTGLRAAVPVSGLRVFVSVDVGELAVEGRTFQLSIPSQPDVGIGMESGNDGPLDHTVHNPAAHVISNEDRLTLSAGPIASGAARPGERDLILLDLVATNTYSTPRTMRGLTFTNTTTGSGAGSALDGSFAVVSIHRDGDGDGVFGGRDLDPLLATSTFVDAEANFQGVVWEIGAGATEHLFLVGEVSLREATDGDLLSASLSSFLGVDFEEPTSVVAHWPLSSGNQLMVDGMVAEQITNFGTGTVTLGAGQGPVAALDVVVPSNGYLADELQRLRIVNYGTADDREIADLRLWRDGGDGSFSGPSGDDVDLGSMMWTGFDWLSPTLVEELPVGGSRYYVSLEVTETLLDSATVQIGIPTHGADLLSGNDGPIDAAVVNPQRILLSSAPLLASLATVPTGTTVGQGIEVRMTVRNQSEEAVDAVAPSELALAGSASLALLSGPAPATGVLEPGESILFVWHYEASNAGTVVFSGRAEGVGSVSNVPSGSLVAESNSHRVYEEARSLALFSSESQPFSVSFGYEGASPLGFTFRNSGGEDGSNVELLGFRFRLVDDHGEGIVPASIVRRVVVREGNRIYVDKRDSSIVNSGSEVELLFSTPVLVTTSEPVSLSLQLDIVEETAEPVFHVEIGASDWFEAEDATSRAPVEIDLQVGDYPIRSGAIRIVSQATSVELRPIESDPIRVGHGQPDVDLLEFEIESIGVDGISSDVRVGAFSVELLDELGQRIEEPWKLLSSISVHAPLGILVEQPVELGGESVIHMDFVNLLSLPVNTPVEIDVVGSVREDASVGAFRARVYSAESVEVRDSETRETVPAVFSSGSIVGALVVIETAADRLFVLGDPLLPDFMMVGEVGIPALGANLRHAGGEGVSRIRLDSVAIRVWNDARQSVDPSLYLDRIALLWNGVEVGVVTDIPSTTGALPIPAGGQLLEPGTSGVFQVVLDLEAGAPAGQIEVTVGESDIDVSEANRALGVSIEPETGFELPIFSGLGRVESPAREIRVGLESLMPAALAADGEETLVARVTLENTADDGSGSIRVESLTLSAASPDDASLDLGGAALEVSAYLGEQMYASSGQLPKDALGALLPFAQSIVVEPGRTVDLELRVAFREDPEFTSLRVGLEEEDIGIVQPDGALFTIEARPVDGQSFPLWSKAGSFAALGLEASYANFPNPFAAGREPTSFVYYLEQPGDVTLRVWTPRGDEVRTVVDAEARSAGLQQADTWDGKNGRGAVVRNGVYVAELKVQYEDGRTERLLHKVAVVR